MTIALTAVALIVTHVLGVLTPDDARVLNTALNIVQVLGLAFIGALGKKWVEEVRAKYQHLEKRVDDQDEQ